MNKLNRILAIGLLSLSIPTASYAGHGEEKEDKQNQLLRSFTRNSYQLCGSRQKNWFYPNKSSANDRGSC